MLNLHVLQLTKCSQVPCFIWSLKYPHKPIRAVIAVPPPVFQQETEAELLKQLAPGRTANIYQFGPK